MSKKAYSKTRAKQFQHDTLYLRFLSYWPIAIEGKPLLCNPKHISASKLAKVFHQNITTIWTSRSAFQEALGVTATDFKLIDVELLNRMSISLNRLKYWGGQADARFLLPKDMLLKEQLDPKFLQMGRSKLEQWRAWEKQELAEGVLSLVPETLQMLLERAKLSAVEKKWIGLVYYIMGEKHAHYCMQLIESTHQGLPTSWYDNNKAEQKVGKLILGVALMTRLKQLPAPHKFISFLISLKNKALVDSGVFHCLEELSCLYQQSIKIDEEALAAYLDELLKLPNWLLCPVEKGYQLYNNNLAIWAAAGASVEDLKLIKKTYNTLELYQVPLAMQKIGDLMAWTRFLGMIQDLPQLNKEKKDKLYWVFHPRSFIEFPTRHIDPFPRLADRLCGMKEYFQGMPLANLTGLFDYLKDWLSLGVNNRGWQLMLDWISPQHLPKIPEARQLTPSKSLQMKLRELGYYRKLLQQPPLPQSILKLQEKEQKLSKQLAYVDKKLQEEPSNQSWIDRRENLLQYQKDLPQLNEKELRNKLKTAFPPAIALSLQQLLRHNAVIRLREEMPWAEEKLKNVSLSFSYAIIAFYRQAKKVDQRRLKRLFEACNKYGEDYKHFFPVNQKWIKEVQEHGQFDVEGWMQRKEEIVTIKARKYTVQDSGNLVEFLVMGNYFDTCLALPDGFNKLSVLLNAIDLNKKLLVIKNHKGKVVGRKLIALNSELQLIGYHDYSGIAGAANEVNMVFTSFCKQIAKRSHTALANTGRPPKLHRGFWYNDGISIFHKPNNIDYLKGRALELMRNRKVWTLMNLNVHKLLPPDINGDYERVLTILEEQGDEFKYLFSVAVQVAKSPCPDMEMLLLLSSTKNKETYGKDALWEWAMCSGKEAIPRLRGIAEYIQTEEYGITAIRALWRIGNKEAIATLGYLFLESACVADELIGFYAISHKGLQQEIIKQFLTYKPHNIPYLYPMLDLFLYFDDSIWQSYLPAVIDQLLGDEDIDEDLIYFIWELSNRVPSKKQREVYASVKKGARNSPKYQAWPCLCGMSPKKARRNWSTWLKSPANWDILIANILLFQPNPSQRVLMEEVWEKGDFYPPAFWGLWMLMTEKERAVYRGQIKQGVKTAPDHWGELALLAEWLTTDSLTFSTQEEHEKVGSAVKKLATNNSYSIWISCISELLMRKVQGASHVEKIGAMSLLKHLLESKHHIWRLTETADMRCISGALRSVCEDEDGSFLVPHILRRIPTRKKFSIEHLGMQPDTEIGYLSMLALIEIVGYEESMKWIHAFSKMETAFELPFKVVDGLIELMGNGNFDEEVALMKATATFLEIWKEPEVSLKLLAMPYRCAIRDAL